MNIFTDRKKEVEFKNLVERFIKRSIKETIGKGPQNVKVLNKEGKLEVVISGIITTYEKALIEATGSCEYVKKNRMMIVKHVSQDYIQEFTKQTGKDIDNLYIEWDFDNDMCVVQARII